jgi:DNA transposition protein
MESLSNQEKDRIRENLRVYVAKYPSQNKAVGSLKNTSVGTVSNIVNGKYENISDEMFRNIASQIGSRTKESGWQIVETSAYQEIRYALDDAQHFRNVTWIVGEAGCGKTTTARLYTDENREVFYILCSEDMKKGDFVREIARKVGIKTDGHNIREIWSLILDDVIQMDAPLLIFDEADKLTEPVFHYFISMYNKLEDKSGIVFMSTDYIKKRISLGLRHQKPGYKEFFSRMGRKYFELEETTANDVYSICVANGVHDKKKIEEVIRDAEPCDFDLRRVKKAIHRTKRMGE